MNIRIKNEVARQSSGTVLRLYFVLLYAAVFVSIAQFWHFRSSESLLIKLYMGAASAGYAALYTLVPMALVALAWRLLRAGKASGAWQVRLIYPLAVLGATMTLLCLYADYRLYALYEYHFNGFVWNLITTPGGIAALGASDSTVLTVAYQVSLFFVGSVLALWLLHRYQNRGPRLSRRFVMAATGLSLFALVSVEGVYAFSTYSGKDEIVEASEIIPFHLHTSLTTLFKRLGIKRLARSNLRVAGGEVNYPAQHLDAVPLKTPPNIIMLVGESFRWDLLSPEITPNLWKLAGRSLRFEQHYSGGNRTRMGLFSMFYGIYAPYWYSFEQQRVAPALMEFLKEKNYQFALHTSQSFDYPELRHTVFAGMAERDMQELKSGHPWQRDRQNITDFITRMDKRDPQRPFYGFMFFESTHAPYTFPDEAALRPDYQQDLNYINLNLKQDIEKIHARYINAAHHIDREVGRLLAYLRDSGLQDNTIVLFTGDHGEEFMEKGHWGHGHGSTFPEEQLRVPLVLSLPGHQPEVIGHRASHLQVAQTLLEALGVKQEAHTYSSAGNLFSQSDYLVAGEYDYMTLCDDNYKISFPYTGHDYFHYTVVDKNDRPVPKAEAKQVVAQYQARLDDVMKESRRFVR